MKRSILALLLAVTLTSLVDAMSNDTLMLIGNEPILVSDFEYVYNKNNQNSVKKSKDLDDYLKLFENFKLKVVEAHHLGLDTLSSFREELENYRNQLKVSYLTDKQKFEELLQEAYERSLEYVNVSHIMVQIDSNALPEDTLIAYQKIMLARQRLMNGEPFENVARDMSEDRSAVRNGGNLGYLTALRTIYSFENAIYRQKVGIVSDIVRTAVGYHIILVHERKQDIGEIHAKHILKSVNPRMSDSEKLQAKVQIDSIAAQLQLGVSFEEMAQKHSDDYQTAVNGGDLSWFGLGKMVREFETPAFALQNIGDVSEPILSPFGWHLIKLEGRRMIDASAKRKNLENMLVRDARMDYVRQSFVEKLKQEYSFTLHPEALDEIRELLKSTNEENVLRQRCSELNKTLFTFADKTILQNDFALLLLPDPQMELFDFNFSVFVSNCLIEYEDTQLERKYLEFKNLMKEYHDGILLFDLSNREIWEKASKDSIGLENYFKSNRKKYKYETPHFRGFVVQCANKNVAKAIKKIIKNANPDSVFRYVENRINIDSIPLVKLEKGLWKSGENSFVDKFEFKQQGKLIIDKNYPVVFTIGQKTETPSDYFEVLGKVISDYQNFLDKAWIEDLRKRYPIKIFTNVKRNMLQKL